MWTRWLPLALLCFLCLSVFTGDAHQTQLRVTVTAYASGILTASGVRVLPGHIALSRDVERALALRFGDRVALAGLGVYTFTDRMPFYWHRRVDVYLPPKSRALQFGKRYATIVKETF